MNIIFKQQRYFDSIIVILKLKKITKDAKISIFKVKTKICNNKILNLNFEKGLGYFSNSNRK
ncbi:hypothetical protein BpHYR1_050858 [Brachionus plicatilis]|uniref:Uncharacterized protein n=1 Tax=Brachionus plicatilis TaxID=10195 RepID=A0A3M7PW96_BRAPC|nr:hypothetical protein BpHYR1_050858 [Brachionus plicatilis]